MQSKNHTTGHIVGAYLGLTHSWIYNQIYFQPKFSSIVLAQVLENQDSFPYRHVYALAAALPSWRVLLERGRRKLLTGYYPYFYKIAKKQQVKLLHAHFGWTGLQQGVPLAKALNVPLITSFYGADMSEKRKGWTDLPKAFARLFATGSLFLVEGPAAKAQLAALGCPQEKIHIQRLGVDLDTIPYRGRSSAPDNLIRILMAATFTEKKGFPYGVEAFCQAAQTDNRLQLTVVGDARPTKPAEMQIKARLKDLIAEYKMAERVTFLGYVPLARLKALAYEHHLFLHPSVTATTGDNEGGSPVVITEMLASGMPVIATHHCDIPQIVRHGETGLLVDERNVEQLRLAILQLAAKPELRLQMGQNGCNHVTRHFSAKKQGQALSEIYAKVLADGPSY